MAAVEVKITGDATELKSAVSSALDSLSSLKSAAAEITSALSSITGGAGLLADAGAAALAGTGIIDMIKDMADEGRQALETASQLKQQADALGLNVEALQQYQYAAQTVGISNQALENGMSHLLRTIGDAGAGNQQAIQLLSKLGISMNDLKGKNVDQALGLIADGFTKITDPAERAQLAMEAFGRGAAGSATQFLNLFGQGADELNDLKNAASTMGAIIPDSVLDNATKANDQLQEMDVILKADKTQSLLQIAPILLGIGNAAVWVSQQTQKLFSGPVAPSSALEFYDQQIDALQDKIKSLTNQSTGDLKLQSLQGNFDPSQSGPTDKDKQTLADYNAQLAQLIKERDQLKASTPDTQPTIGAGTGNDEAFQSMLQGVQAQIIALTQGSQSALQYKLNQDVLKGSLTQTQASQVLATNATLDGVKAAVQASNETAKQSQTYEQLNESIQDQITALQYGSDAVLQNKLNTDVLTGSLTQAHAAEISGQQAKLDSIKATVEASNELADLSGLVEKSNEALNAQKEAFTEGTLAAKIYTDTLNVGDDNLKAIIAGNDSASDAMNKMNAAAEDGFNIYDIGTTTTEAYTLKIQALIDKLNAGTVGADVFNSKLLQLEQSMQQSQAANWQQITEQTQTPFQKYQSNINNLNDAYQALPTPTDAQTQEFGQAQTTYYNQFLQESQKAADSWAGVWKKAGDSLATGIGGAFAKVIMGQESLQQAALQILEDFTQQIIEGLLTEGVKDLISDLNALNTTSSTSTALTATSSQSSLLSDIESFLGLGGGAAGAAAGAVVDSSDDAAGVLSLVDAMGHDGIDSVPTDGTWLLQSGERVLNRPQNEKLTDYIDNRADDMQRINENIMKAVRQSNQQAQAPAQAAPIINLSHSITMNATDTDGMQNLIKQVTPVIQQVSVAAVQKAYNVRGKPGPLDRRS